MKTILLIFGGYYDVFSDDILASLCRCIFEESVQNAEIEAILWKMCKLLVCVFDQKMVRMMTWAGIRVLHEADELSGTLAAGPPACCYFRKKAFGPELLVLMLSFCRQYITNPSEVNITEDSTLPA